MNDEYEEKKDVVDNPLPYSKTNEINTHLNNKYLSILVNVKNGIDLPINTLNDSVVYINISENEKNENPCFYSDITMRSHLYLDDGKYILVDIEKDEKYDLVDFLLSFEKQPSIIINNKTKTGIDIRYEDVILCIPPDNYQPIEWDSLCGFPFISAVNKQSQYHIFDSLHNYPIYIRSSESNWSSPLILENGKYNIILNDKNSDNKYSYYLIVQNYGGTREIIITQEVETEREYHNDINNINIIVYLSSF